MSFMGSTVSKLGNSSLKQFRQHTDKAWAASSVNKTQSGYEDNLSKKLMMEECLRRNSLKLPMDKIVTKKW